MTPDIKTVLVFQYKTLQRWARAIPGGLEDGDWLVSPSGMKNHAHWIYGHIAVTSDVAPAVDPGGSLVPEAWRLLFDQGSKPDPEGISYPAPSELAAFTQKTLNRVIAVIGDLDPVTLSEPPLQVPNESIKDFLRTRERCLAFAPEHLSYHLGQIQLIQRILHPDTVGL